MAEDGPTAIELAQENDIDVAILDIRMAGMSGIEVLERLRFVRPNIEAIMITAFETTDTMRQALRLRACDYINKPFDLATIRSAVNQAMQRRVLESEIHNSAEKVHELLTELQNQRVEEQIAQTRGDIYASIIHDINGPLSVSFGFCAVAEPETEPELAAGSGGSWNSSRNACASSSGRWATASRFSGATSVFSATRAARHVRRRKPFAARSGAAGARASELAGK